MLEGSGDSNEPRDGSDPMSLHVENRRLTMLDLQRATDSGEKWAVITAYDAITAGLFEQSGIPAILVGDSAAMVVHGHSSTIPITVEEMVPMVQGVVRGTQRAVVIADLPFGSYQLSPAQALESAAAFMKEGGAQAVKLEGGSAVLPQVEALASAGVPVIGHLGLTPQSVNLLGGYRVQGRGESGEMLLRDAKALEAAGATAIVLEVVPSDLAARVSEVLSIPTIGIGAGSQTDAQVIVWQDLLGLTPDPAPRFVKRYANLREVMGEAVRAWVNDVQSGAYPAPEHEYR
jgi:3-methyl-2-oxobutanoate hydroxymethyltransferase